MTACNIPWSKIYTMTIVTYFSIYVLGPGMHSYVIRRVQYTILYIPLACTHVVINVAFNKKYKNIGYNCP